MTSAPPIFDGHNDVVSRLLEAERAERRSLVATGQRAGGRGFFERGEQGHIDLPRAGEGGFGGGLFSIYVVADPDAPPSGPALGIDPRLDALEVFHRAGLRSPGPVWSRPNDFGARGCPTCSRTRRTPGPA